MASMQGESQSLYGRVRLQGLHGRVNLISRVCPAGTKCGAVDSLGGPQFGVEGGVLGQTIDSVIGSAYRMIKLISGLGVFTL